MWSQDLYLKAINFAANAHKDQKMEGKNYSYIVHFTSVCMEVIACLFNSKIKNEDIAIQCALLHDTIEDTEITYHDILNNFGAAVADGVQALTKDKKLQKTEQMHDSLERIKKLTDEIGIVKMADRIVNLQEPPPQWPREKIFNYCKEAKLIHQSLKHCNSYLADRLFDKIINYENLYLPK
jgi:(p)ppGpp synthase/HD superfamily hydrolase